MQSPMNFEPVENGFHVTFGNGWSVVAWRPANPDSIEVSVKTPLGSRVLVYGHSSFFVDSDDLAAVLTKTSNMPVDFRFDRDPARVFEAFIESLTEKNGVLVEVQA